MIGRCFVLSQDLRVRDELDGGEWKFCQGRPQGHDRFGSCQQGLAAAFSRDQHYILFGAPGTYNWKGEGGQRGAGGGRWCQGAWGGCAHVWVGVPAWVGVCRHAGACSCRSTRMRGVQTWGASPRVPACGCAIGVSVWLRARYRCGHLCMLCVSTRVSVHAVRVCVCMCGHAGEGEHVCEQVTGASMGVSIYVCVSVL